MPLVLHNLRSVIREVQRDQAIVMRDLRGGPPPAWRHASQAAAVASVFEHMNPVGDVSGTAADVLHKALAPYESLQTS